MAQLVLAPALVQGEDAPFSLIRSLKALDEWGNCDVIIIGRGGGSMEDLWCFNDERLVMQVAACKTPVISAVGHETDFTLCDYAADLRAPTPSAAAELASVDQQELQNTMELLRGRIAAAAFGRVQQCSHRLEMLKDRPCFRQPERELKKYTKNLEYLANSIQIAWKNGIIGRQERLKMQAARLNALNPLARLAGGYSVTMKDGEILSSVKTVQQGDILQIRLADGMLESEVTKVSLLEE